MTLQCIPEVNLSSSDSKTMPVMGLGTAANPALEPEVVVQVVCEAIELGYRMFDTASLYNTEEALGDAIAEALARGLVKSRDELFITSKIWCHDNHGELVLPALQKSLKNMKLDYLDQYLIHFPVSLRIGACPYPPKPEDVVPMDMKAVWSAMEECQTLGLAKSIGVSNFSCKKIAEILEFAKIPPAVNQVEMNPTWQQAKLRKFCQEKGIRVAAYSPLGSVGATWGTKGVLESEVLAEIAKAHEKSVAQVALRWAYEQGAIIVVKSVKKERLKQNMEIFDWKLTEEDSKKIAEIPQCRAHLVEKFISEDGLIKSLDELWEGEI